VITVSFVSGLRGFWLKSSQVLETMFQVIFGEEWSEIVRHSFKDLGHRVERKSLVVNLGYCGFQKSLVFFRDSRSKLVW
jgi:hypothetical protein